MSLVFLWMIRHQLMALLMGAILAGLSAPLYEKLLRGTRNRRSIAAAITVLLLLLLIIIPGMTLLGIVAAQALEVGETVGPWLQQQASGTDDLDSLLAKLPYADNLAPYRGHITAKLAELTGTVGQFAVNALASATKGTAAFFFNLFITLYAIFFFLRYGRGTLDRILYYLPLKSEDEDRLVSRFLSVSRATVKGTLVIALVQGALGAAGLAMMGIGGAVFWGAVIAVLSLIPAVGPAVIWIPVTIYLAAVGRVGPAIFIVAWFNIVVGTSDNILRPILVGKDTEMSDLMVLVSTVGGLATFGMNGLILGPILAALFDTVWSIYGEAFKNVLPPRKATATEE
jgi:predicted PurR-regulated permease PerM